jgi:hypothetical protein
MTLGLEIDACNSSATCIRGSSNHSNCGTQAGRSGGDPSGSPGRTRQDHTGATRPPTARQQPNPGDRQPNLIGAATACAAIAAIAAADNYHLVKRAEILRCTIAESSASYEIPPDQMTLGLETDACNSSTTCIRGSGDHSNCGTQAGRSGGDPSGSPGHARQDHAGATRPPTARHQRKPGDRQPNLIGAATACAATTPAAADNHYLVKRAEILKCTIAESSAVTKYRRIK